MRLARVRAGRSGSMARFPCAGVPRLQPLAVERASGPDATPAPARSATEAPSESELSARPQVRSRPHWCPDGAISCQCGGVPSDAMAVAPAAGPAAGLPSPMRSSLTATPSPRVDRPRALHGVPATDQSDPWRTVESQGTSTHSLTRPSSDRAADCPDFARAACICPLRRSGCRSPIPAGRGPSLGAGAGIYLAPLIGS